MCRCVAKPACIVTPSDAIETNEPTTERTTAGLTEEARAAWTWQRREEMLLAAASLAQMRGEVCVWVGKCGVCASWPRDSHAVRGVYVCVYTDNSCASRPFLPPWTR